MRVSTTDFPESASLKHFALASNFLARLSGGPVSAEHCLCYRVSGGT